MILPASPVPPSHPQNSDLRLDSCQTPNATWHAHGQNRAPGNSPIFELTCFCLCLDIRLAYTYELEYHYPWTLGPTCRTYAVLHPSPSASPFLVCQCVVIAIAGGGSDRGRGASLSGGRENGKCGVSLALWCFCRPWSVLPPSRCSYRCLGAKVDRGPGLIQNLQRSSERKFFHREKNLRLGGRGVGRMLYYLCLQLRSFN